MTLPISKSSLCEVKRCRYIASETVEAFSQQAEPRDAVDEVARERYAEARRVFPMIALPAAVFIAYLTERAPAGVALELGLRQLHTTDLYLACACRQGDPRALAAFEDHCVRGLDRVLGRLGLDDDAIAEIKQQVRSRVLTGARAELADFGGRGDLRGWIRVMAVRLALQHLRRGRREQPLDEDDRLPALVAPGDLALDPAKGAYRAQFAQAFEAALHALASRDRTVLRQHYLDGLTIDELGALYRVHRSTAARLVQRARDQVIEATRARMMADLGVGSPDLDSIMRLIRSRLEISMRALLRGRRR